MFKKTRRVFRRGPKARVFWYAPPDCFDGTAKGTTVAPSAEVLTTLVAVPYDVPAAGLIAAQEAPHNDKVTVHRIIGDITCIPLFNSAGAALQVLGVRWGLTVLKGNAREGAAIAVATDAAEAGGLQLLGLTPFDASRRWLHLGGAEHYGVVDAVPKVSLVWGDPLTHHIDVRVKVVLKQGETLFLVKTVAADVGVATGYQFRVNLRSLCSTAR